MPQAGGLVEARTRARTPPRRARRPPTRPARRTAAGTRRRPKPCVRMYGGDAAMTVPQPGIFAQGTRSHAYLEFDVRPAADPDGVLTALRSLREPPVTS